MAVSYQQPSFAPGEYYHLYNRGVAKQLIFSTDQDREHLCTTFGFYLESNPNTKLAIARRAEDFEAKQVQAPQEPLVEVIGYCLMPNHFHLVVQELLDQGITKLMSRSLNSYSRYYNTKYDRVGSMFQGTFRAVHISTTEQLLHVIRYAHLNPVVAGMVDDPADYHWSSHQAFLNQVTSRLSHPALPLSIVGGAESYQKFVNDHRDYARQLGLIKKHCID